MKNPKIKFSVILCSVILLILSCEKKQMTPMMELIKIGQDLELNSSIKYSFSINTKRSYADNSPTRKGIMSFLENKSDTSIGMNFRIQEKNFEIIYDGNYLFTLMKRDSIAMKKPLNNYKEGHCTIYPELEMSYRAINLFLTDPNIKNEINSLTKNDTLINSELCTKYSFIANEKFLSTHKNYFKNDVNVELIIQRKNSLPLYYSQKIELKSGNQIHTNFSEIFFSQYSFNNNFSSSFFTPASIPSYYNWTKLKFLNKTLPKDTPAPQWTLPKIEGDSISLKNLEGKYVLLDFWFIGCGACIQSIPMLNELQSNFSNDQLTVIGINCFTNDLSKIKSYCANQGMKYQNVWMGDVISQAYGINAAPIYYLINPEGNIVYTQFGHDEELLENVESIVNKNTP